MNRPARKGAASKKPIRADRSHRGTTRSPRCTPSRAGWRQQPAAENAPRMSADEILQQYHAATAVKEQQ